MRDVLDDEGRRNGPASIFALAAMAIIGAAVIYNSLFAQDFRNRVFEAADESLGVKQGTTARLALNANEVPGNTIQLKYDPLVEEVQRQLLASGYYKGIVDGVVGKRTRAAIEAYQGAMGLERTGEPSARLAEHIRYTRQIAEASLFTGTVKTDTENEQRAQIRRLQTGLAELAYSPGEISGKLNQQTRVAIKLFQRDRGLEETGEISSRLLAELGKLSGQSALISD
ncbi:MAG: peptidoglycan-binding domain-containing protein [Aestuariivirga sp.]